MWAVSAKRLCNKHLLGEHVEMHMFVGTILKNISIKGYISKGLVNPRKIIERHNEIAQEMLNRNMNHKSPLEFDCSILPNISLSVKNSRDELRKRCKNCLV